MIVRMAGTDPVPTCMGRGHPMWALGTSGNCLRTRTSIWSRELADAGDSARDDGAGGTVVAVIGGRGGAGASLFAVALAQAASDSLLVDVDPWAGGIDLVVGAEATPGVRWPDLALQGRTAEPASAVRDALPPTPRNQHAVRHPARLRRWTPAQCRRSSTRAVAAGRPWFCVTSRVDCHRRRRNCLWRQRDLDLS